MAKQRRNLRASGVVRQRARELRSEQTHAEKALWQRLRDRQLGGLKFRRQHPIGRFVVDFFCAQAGLVVELDGEIYQGKEAYDAGRTKVIETKGYRVIRFPNADVEHDIEGVLEQIQAAALSEERSLNKEVHE